jgi:hypothetical protein
VIALLLGGLDPERVSPRRVQVREDVAPMEHDPTVQARKEGYYRLTLETYTPVAFPGVQFVDTDDAAVTAVPSSATRVTGEALLAPLDIWFSPLLDLTIDDIPANFSFGNGSTGPKTFSITRDGVTTKVLAVICVFPVATVLDADQKLRLQEIFEGIPPGSAPLSVK